MIATVLRNLHVGLKLELCMQYDYKCCFAEVSDGPISCWNALCCWDASVPLLLCCRDANVPFAQWNSEQVAAWLHGMGLSMYVGEAKRWVKSGLQLLNATVYDLVKVNVTRLSIGGTYLVHSCEAARGSDCYFKYCIYMCIIKYVLCYVMYCSR